MDGLILAAAAPSPGPIGGAAARQAARDELSKPQYHRDDSGPLQRLGDWLLDRLDWLTSGSTGSVAVLLLLGLLVAGLILVLVRAGRIRRIARAEVLDETDPLRPLAAADHYRRAQRLAEQGRWDEALRDWLRAAVQTIEQRGVLDPLPGRTGAEIARQAGAVLPDAADALRLALDRFDQVWFGGRPATEVDAQAGQAAADRVRGARLVSPARRATSTR